LRHLLENCAAIVGGNFYLPYFSAVIVLSACAPAGLSVQAKLDAIADQCGLPRSTFKVRGKDNLVFQPPLDAEYEAVDCALKQVRKLPEFPTKMGFVGNERYGNFDEAFEPEANNAQKN
jgi:hypothetical protein